MDALSAIFAGAPALLAAFVLSPVLLHFIFSRDRRLPAVMAGAGMAGLALNTALPVLLHTAGIPITRVSLALAHLILAAALFCVVLTFRFRCAGRGAPRGMQTGENRSSRLIVACAAALALVLFPWTYLAGIDTYKWQCLASNVRLAEKIPWLIHPLSLLGFTPRAYPPVQPLMLATVQILVPADVDFGFFVVSVFTAVAGLAAAHELGLRVFGNQRAAFWLAVFYAFSPVFMRYTHWATGRGVFMAVMPMLLLHARGMPSPRSAAGLVVAAALLALSHRAGIVTLAVMAAGAAAAVFLRSRFARPVILAAAATVIVLAPFLSVGFLLPGAAGRIAGAVKTGVSRFGVLIPLAIACILSPGFRPVTFFARALVLPGFVFFLLSFDSDMYAAMPASILAALAAAMAMPAIELKPGTGRAARIAAVTCLAAGAIAVLAKRTFNATPRHVRRAAAAIQALDPSGPILVEAPGMARRQIHGYVHGCPRFETGVSSGRVSFSPPPPLKGPPSAVIRTWIAWARGAVSMDDAWIDWYGTPHATYYVRIRGQGDIPPGAQLVYSDADITIAVMRSLR